jgi:light-regulated signal transduction histidine kinase (bacteriophytochrome)
MWRVLQFKDLRKSDSSAFFDSTISQISKSLANFLGKSPEELNKKYKKILFSEDMEKLYSFYNQKILDTFNLIQKSFASEIESIYKHSDGNLYHMTIETSFFIEKTNYNGISFGYIKNYKRIEKNEEYFNIINNPKYIVTNPRINL